MTAAAPALPAPLADATRHRDEAQAECDAAHADYMAVIAECNDAWVDFCVAYARREQAGGDAALVQAQARLDETQAVCQASYDRYSAAWNRYAEAASILAQREQWHRGARMWQP